MAWRSSWNRRGNGAESNAVDFETIRAGASMARRGLAMCSFECPFRPVSRVAEPPIGCDTNARRPLHDDCCIHAQRERATYEERLRWKLPLLNIRFPRFHTRPARRNAHDDRQPPTANAPHDASRRRVAHADCDLRSALGLPANGRQHALAAPDRKRFRRVDRREARKVAILSLPLAVREDEPGVVHCARVATKGGSIA